MRRPPSMEATHGALRSEVNGSAITARRRAWQHLGPVVAIVAIYVAGACLVDPRGEFPLNDDWSYTRSAFRLGSGEGLHVDEWAAPSLIGQALYGGALVSIFGPSFTLLRLSTIALSCALALMIWFALSALQVRRELVWTATASWIFNPVQFCLSFSFMTEIPFLFFVALGTLLYILHLRSGGRTALLLCAAAFGYAFTIRQMAVLFIGPLIVSLLPRGTGERRGRNLLNLALVACVSGAFIGAYEIFVAWSGGETPAAKRKYELLRHITLDQIAGNTFGILFYVAFMLLPLAVVLAPLLWHGFGRLARGTVGLAWTVVSGSGWAWLYWRYSGPPYLPGRPFHPQMPFLLNILYDTGLGPVTLDPTYYGAPEIPVHPRLWMAITVLTVAALVPLGMLISAAVMRSVRLREPLTPGDRIGIFAVLSFLAVTSFEVVFSHLQEGGLFDRHVLTAVFPAIFAMAAVPGLHSSGARPPHATRAVAVVMLALLAWFCIAGTHDYLAWNRIRWNLGREVLAEGVDPLHVSFGFEFNGWYNYDTFRSRGNVGKVYYWWHDREDYLITMSPQEGYSTLHTRTYFSWLHRYRVPLYLMKGSR